MPRCSLKEVGYLPFFVSFCLHSADGNSRLLNGKGFHRYKKAGKRSGFGDYLLVLRGINRWLSLDRLSALLSRLDATGRLSARTPERRYLVLDLVPVSWCDRSLRGPPGGTTLAV